MGSGDRTAQFLRQERAAWCLLGAVALVSRLAGLGRRPLSYDEGVHAFLAWQLAETGWYFHSPVTHGPLLFYVNALIHMVLAATDFTARLGPAVAGSVLVLLPFLFRRWTGAGVALAAGALLCFSPLVLYYSRYLRNEAYIACLCLLWIWSCFRYLEARGRGPLFALVIASSLSVLSKEVAFIFAAIMALFLTGVAIRSRDRRLPASELVVLQATLFLPYAMPLVLSVLSLEGWLEFCRSSGLAAGGLVAAGMLLGAGIAGLWARFGMGRSGTAGTAAVGSGDLDSVDRRGTSGGVETVAFYLNFGLWLRLAALAWGLQAIYFTTFLKNPAGLVSGFFGSVSYWLTQQPVMRGDQPWFYYLLLLAWYESFLLLAAAWPVAAGIRSRWKPTFRPDPLESPTVSGGHGRQGAGPGDRAWSAGSGRPMTMDRLFSWFCLWWLLLALVAYTWAGEKMPWLTVHLVLPLIWLASAGVVGAVRCVARALSAAGTHGTDLPADDQASRPDLQPALVLVPSLLFFAGVCWLQTGSPGESMLDQVRRNAGWLGVATGLAGAAWPVARAWVRGKLQWGVMAAGVLLLVGAGWLRTGLLWSHFHPESPGELGVYAHADPEIGELLEHLQGLDPDCRIAVVRDAGSPTSWYLRNFEHREDSATLAEALAGDPDVIVARAPLPPDLGDVRIKYDVKEFPYLCWPGEGYKDLSIRRLLPEGLSRRRLLHFWGTYRDRSSAGPQGLGQAQRMGVFVAGRPCAAERTGRPVQRADSPGEHP